jgi:hypothetical protein
MVHRARFALRRCFHSANCAVSHRAKTIFRKSTECRCASPSSKTLEPNRIHRLRSLAKTRQNNSMSDFFQTGAVATLHRLGKPEVARLEKQLLEFAVESPIALVLPCHVKELGTQALRHIVRELRNVS